MDLRARGSATLVIIILLGGIVFSVANILILLMTVKGSIEVPPLFEFYHLCPPCMIYFIAAPLVVAVLVAIMVSQAAAPAADSAASEPVPSAAFPPSPDAALRLLAVLQQDGRFIDFVKEEIDGYSDAQVGAAVRSIHAGCRKALADRVEFERIFSAEDGSQVDVQPGFDPAAVRLTGNVAGSPPFHGTLQHGGWRAIKVTLPESPGVVDPHIIAPAEVEIP